MQNNYYIVEESGTYTCQYLTTDPSNWRDRNVYIAQSMKYTSKKFDKRLCYMRDKHIISAIEKLIEKQTPVVEFL